MALVNSGFDGTVNEAQFANMWALGGVDGVESSGAWAVTQGTGRQVSVAAQSGYAFARGVLSKDAASPILQNLSTPTNGQWHLIVRRIDWSTNTVTVAAIAHTTTSTTVPVIAPGTFPTFNNNPGVLYDHKLAWAWVNSVNTTVTLFDLRTLGLETRLTAFALASDIVADRARLTDLETGQLANLQRDTTNVLVRTITQAGQGKIAGAAALDISETLTFPVPFLAGTVPVVTATFAGAINPSGAYNPGATVASNTQTAYSHAPSNTGCTVHINRPANMTAGVDYYYTWTAIGQIV